MSWLDDPVYVSCRSTDRLFDCELRSIVNYVFKDLRIDGNAGPDDNYRTYCYALEGKLGTGETYDRKKTIHTTSAGEVARELKNLLPDNSSYIPSYQNMIEIATQTSKSVDNLSQIEHPGHLIFRFDEKDENSSYFPVVKIFRNGNTLEIIPCLLSVRSKKSVGGFLFLRSTEEFTTICYSQTKYCISKYYLEEVVKRVQAQAISKW